MAATLRIMPEHGMATWHTVLDGLAAMMAMAADAKQAMMHHAGSVRKQFGDIRPEEIILFWFSYALFQRVSYAIVWS